jgi:uncharacterized membrane protein YbhN (UPF0104 family)
MKKILGYLLPIAIAAFLLWYAYRDQDFSKMMQDMSEASPLAVSLTFVTTLIAHFVRALRWNMLFEPLGYRATSTGSFLAVMSGYFANLLVPRAGELSRCTILAASEDIPIQTAIGTVLAERGFDMLMLMLIALAAFGLEYETLSHFLARMQEQYGVSDSGGSNLKFIFLGGMVVCGLFVFIFRNTLSQIPVVAKILGMINGLMEGLLSVTKLKRPALFILLTFLIWGGYYTTTYFSLWMFGFTHDLGWNAAFMLLIVGSFGIVVPVPGAVGGPFQVFVSAALIQLYHKEPQMSITAASMMYWCQVFFSLTFGGVCYLLAIVKANQKKRRLSDV